jgi:hypothetical protein
MSMTNGQGSGTGHAHHHEHHDHDHGGHGHGGHSQWLAAAHATLHCSIGCIIGETVGLMLGTTLGFSQLLSMVVATVLAYVSGFSLAVFPLMRRTCLSARAAFAAIWLGEAISIGVMELVMNTIDYHMGGMRTGSVLNPRFWEALVVATLAGFLVAWPVNAWLIAKQLRQHH